MQRIYSLILVILLTCGLGGAQCIVNGNKEICRPTHDSGSMGTDAMTSSYDGNGGYPGSGYSASLMRLTFDFTNSPYGNGGGVSQNFGSWQRPGGTYSALTVHLAALCQTTTSQSLTPSCTAAVASNKGSPSLTGSYTVNGGMFQLNATLDPSTDITTMALYAVLSGGCNGYSSCGYNFVIFDIWTEGTLVVPPFTLPTQMGPYAVGAGSSTTLSVANTLSAGFNAPITMSASSPQLGLTTTFSPNPIPAPGSSTYNITISATKSVPGGSYPITLTGTAGGATQSVTWNMYVTNFALSASPSSVSVQAGNCGSSTITITSPGSPSGSPIGLSAPGLPSGVTVSFNPTWVPPNSTTTSTMTICTNTSMSGGTFTVTATGTNGAGLVQSTPVTLNVTPLPPAAPTNLSAAVAADGRTVSLTWMDNATTETYYKLQRCTGTGCAPADYWTLASNVTSKVDATAAGTTYRYNVCAANAGGVTCAAAPLTVIVPNPSTVTLSASPNPSVYGQNVTLTATIQSGATGVIDFLDGGNHIGTPGIAGTTATVTTAALGAGTHTLVASYGGDNNWGPGTSPPISVTVHKAILYIKPTSATMVQGAPVPTLTYSAMGFVNGDSDAVLSGAPVLSTTATSSSGIGYYAVTSDVGTLAANNYDFSPIDGVLTVTDTEGDCPQCESDDDCPGGLVCIYGECGCSDPCDDPACPEWEASCSNGCTSDSDCPGGLVCVSGQCGCSDPCDDPSCPGWEPSCGCATDAGCQGGLVCINGQCGCSDPCDDPSCPGWEPSCSSGCTSDAGCQGGLVCINGQCGCSDPCDDPSCPGWDPSCSSSSGCTSDADCPGGLVCMNGQCGCSDACDDSSCSGYDYCACNPNDPACNCPDVCNFDCSDYNYCTCYPDDPSCSPACSACDPTCPSYNPCECSGCGGGGGGGEGGGDCGACGPDDHDGICAECGLDASLTSPSPFDAPDIKQTTLLAAGRRLYDENQSEYPDMSACGRGSILDCYLPSSFIAERSCSGRGWGYRSSSSSWPSVSPRHRGEQR